MEAVTSYAEQEKKKFIATKSASLSEYQEIMHRSKQPMQHKPWQPKHIETDPEKESELMKNMQNDIVELEKSDFYSNFLQQIQTPQFLNHFSRVLGSEPKFQVVIYGQTDVALILLMKRDYFNDQIGEMQIFYSNLDQTAVRVLEELGFSVLRVDENSYRKVSQPTLFFIPYCGFEVYGHVLRANWKPENLNRMILLGTSFKLLKFSEVSVTEHLRLGICPSNGRKIPISRYLMCISRFSTEVPLCSFHGDKFFQRFSSLSWHFFIWFDDVPRMKPLLKSVVVVVGLFYYLFYKYIKCKRLYNQVLHEGRNYSSFFRLGWLFRRHRMRLDKQCLLEEKKKKRMLFYVNRAIVLPWLEGLPRNKWAEVREISRGVMTWMKENDDKISNQELDILIQAWF